METYERLKHLRKSLGMTQEEFCKRINLKRPTLSLIESGKGSLTDRTIITVCKEFDINEDWLRNGGSDEDMFVQHSDEDAELYEKIGEMLAIKDPNSKKIMIRWIMSLSYEELDMCLTLAEKLVKAFDED